MPGGRHQIGIPAGFKWESVAVQRGIAAAQSGHEGEQGLPLGGGRIDVHGLLSEMEMRLLD